MAGWIWVVIVLAVLVCVGWRSGQWYRSVVLEGCKTGSGRSTPGQRARPVVGERPRPSSPPAKSARHAHVRALSPDARRRYASRWEDVQAEFVDAPVDAVAHADGLVSEVMSERGYPMEDFEQRVADVSVDHPVVVENYRAAHRIVVAMDRGEASTEEERRRCSTSGRSSTTCSPKQGSAASVARHIGHRTGRSLTMNDRSQGLTTADIAGSGGSDDIGAHRSGPERFGRAEDATNRHDQPGSGEPLLGPTESKRFTDEWRSVQGQFVDQPREAVEQADRLVADLMQRLASEFAETRANLERQWDGQDDISTEELRVAMTRYRSFFDRLLSA